MLWLRSTFLEANLSFKTAQLNMNEGLESYFSKASQNVLNTFSGSKISFKRLYVSKEDMNITPCFQMTVLLKLIHLRETNHLKGCEVILITSILLGN